MKPDPQAPLDRKGIHDYYRTSTAYQVRMASKGDSQWEAVFRQYAAQVLHHCPPAARVLDLGCGGGWSCKLFVEARPDLWVIGCDLTCKPFLGGAAPVSPDISFVEGDAMRLPFASSSFDVVASLAMLEHIPDAERALDEMVRILRPGGIVVVCGPNILSPLRLARLFVKGVVGRRFHPDGRPWNALALFLTLLRKMFSGGPNFQYRHPVLDRGEFHGSDWDAVYLLNPVDMARYARSRRLQLISRSSGGRPISRIVARVLPNLASGVCFVARKDSC